MCLPSLSPALPNYVFHPPVGSGNPVCWLGANTAAHSLFALTAPMYTACVPASHCCYTSVLLMKCNCKLYRWQGHFLFDRLQSAQMHDMCMGSPLKRCGTAAMLQSPRIKRMPPQGHTCMLPTGILSKWRPASLPPDSDGAAAALLLCLVEEHRRLHTAALAAPPHLSPGAHR